MPARGKARRSILKSSLPEDVLTSGARVTMIAQGSVLVEGQRGVVELSERRIRLRTAGGVLAIEGEALCLRELSLDAAMITGAPVTGVVYRHPETGRNLR